MLRSVRRSTLIILLLWAGITALELNKAFHIDDTFYLIAAQWVEHHPLQPLSGMVNWSNGPQRLYEGNQPPGFMYLVAATGHLFGYTEVPLQVMISLFTLLALFNFHILAKHLAPGSELTATALLAFCPAFLVNQNIMAEIPLLALHILAFRWLLVPGRTAAVWRYLLAAIALSIAMFFKYNTAPLLLVFPMVLAFRREWRYLPLAFLPFALLTVWGVWNMSEFGFVHLLDRTGGDPSWRGLYVRTLSLLTCLGAISPFTPVFARVLVPHAGRWLFNVWLVAIGLCFALVAAAWWHWLPEVTTDEVLRIAFTLNGLLFLILSALALPRSFALGRADTWALATWGVSLLLFTALFAPGMATRYVLLALPPLLLLLAPSVRSALRHEKALAVACTAALGLLLTISDKQFAGFYRQEAPRIAQELKHQTTGTVWNLGHWGWQWYAEQAGMPMYGRTTSHVMVGDILVVPEDYDAHLVDERLTVEPIARWTGEPELSTFFCVEQFAGMYASSYGKLPWSLSRSHEKVIVAYRVMAVR